MTRQPEIGSAHGLTTAEVVTSCDQRLVYLRGLRSFLIGELVKAQESLTAGDPPITITIQLHRATHSMLYGQPDTSGMDAGDHLPHMTGPNRWAS